MNCHICGSETDFTCDRCDEPVCFDCCVPMTIHNQIDYPLCTICEEVREDLRRLELEREYAKEEAEKKTKEERRSKARANYLKPENVAKRVARKAEQKKKRQELREKQLAEAIQIVKRMFRQPPPA